MTTSALYQQLQQGLQARAPRVLNQSDYAEAAVLVALTDEEDCQLILTRRSMHLSTHQGEVAFPGGKRDPDDVDLQATALREAHEEVGLRSSDVRVIGQMDQVISRFGYVVTPILGLVDPDVSLVANQDELDVVFKVPLSFFKQVPEQYFEMGDVRIPSYQYDEFLIWGLTAMMIVEMLNHIWGADIPMHLPPSIINE